MCIVANDSRCQLWQTPHAHTHTYKRDGSVRQQQEQKKNCDTLQLSGVAMCMYRSNQFH